MLPEDVIKGVGILLEELRRIPLDSGDFPLDFLRAPSYYSPHDRYKATHREDRPWAKS
jgi:hypothetical protein